MPALWAWFYGDWSESTILFLTWWTAIVSGFVKWRLGEEKDAVVSA